MEPKYEDLHLQASSHYLKGEFDAAMAVWRQVIELKPDDERAREGIRLCEQLADGVDPSQSAPAEVDSTDSAQESLVDSPPVVATSPSPVAPTDSPPSVVEDALEPDPRLEIDLPATQAVEAQPAQQDAGDDGPGLDLSQLGDSPPAVDSPVDAPAGTPAGESPVEAAPAIDESAAQELRRRVDDLLMEARALAEQGDTERALKTIDRVLILDEESEAAMTLREALEGPGEEEEEDEAEAEELGFAEPESAAAEAPGEGLPDLEALPLSEPVGEEPADAESPVDAKPAAEPAATKTPPAAATAPVKRSFLAALPPWIQDRRVIFGAGGVLVVLAVFLALQMFGGGEAVTSEPITAGVAAGADAQANAPTVPTEPGAPAASDPMPVVEDLAALMQEAQAAFEAEKYAAAVIAFDQVLKQQPENAEASVLMKVAADRYREQQERQERWDTALTAFEEQNYAEALRLFYRMPANEYEADIDRYKVNGWYNLGVAALQAKDCRRAIENLEEARGIAPRDEGVLTALDLAQMCRGPAVLEDMKRLRLRALND